MIEKLIISRAHEVVQRIPLSGKTYFCVRCNLSGPLSKLFGTIRCIPHFELITSGWKDEA